MKIQLLSDLHAEFQASRNDTPWFNAMVPPEKPDLLVVAGDLVPWKEKLRAQKALDELSKRFTDILYVPGNHELYGLSPAAMEEQLEEIDVPSNVEVVTEPRLVVFKGQRFLCGTMWYSRKEVEATGCIDPKTGVWIEGGRLREFSDFRHVRHLHPWVYQANAAFRQLLEERLQEGDVVVTHHLPTEECTPLPFRGKVDNCFFVSDQTDLIVARKPRLWLHGHTHSNVDVQVEATRVLANPHGYPGERQKNKEPWDPFRAMAVL